MKANELCPAPHLEAADLCGEDMKVEIERVGFSEVGAEKENKGVIYFKDLPRGMVVNRTNLKRIVAQLGDDTDEWVGKAITLYPSETDYAGKTVPCIRVREK